MRGRVTVSRWTFASGEGEGAGTDEVMCGAGSISWTMFCEDEGMDMDKPRDEDPASEGNGNELMPRSAVEFSASVSVSVSSPGGLLTLDGFPVRLNKRTDSSPLSAKWTFLWMFGVDGALCARRCLVRSMSEMLGLEHDDFKDDLSCLPLERMMGVEGVRGREEALEGEGIKGESRYMSGMPLGDGRGEEAGNGTDAEEDENAVFGFTGAGISM